MTISNVNINAAKMDTEYISLISSLEIVIVFGWGIPIIIPIYNVVVFGYGLVYYYWLNQENSIKFYMKGRQINLKIMGKWLTFSVLIQQILGVTFYYFGQISGIIVCNFVILIMYYIFSLYCCASGSNVIPAISIISTSPKTDVIPNKENMKLLL